MPSIVTQQIREILMEAAGSGRTMSYASLGLRLGLGKMDPASFQRYLARPFDEIDREDAADGRPFLTSVVVLKDEGRPGVGYYKSLYNMAKRGNGRPSDDLWVAEVNALFRLHSGLTSRRSAAG
jgi:hypothetical protein